MSMILRRAIQQSLSVGSNVTKVFSTDLWTGTSALNSIDTGLDFVNNDGLAWVKSRTQSSGHRLADTLRGAISTLQSNESNAETLNSLYFDSFTETGYDINTATDVNQSGQNYVGWNFLKAPNFFDVIKYTGDGVAGREIPHELGVQAGMCIVKNIDEPRPWNIQHVSRGGTKYLILNEELAELTANSRWNDTAMNGDNVTVGGSSRVNQINLDYIMYLFAHDPSPEGVIQCGQYTGNGTTSNFVELETSWAEGLNFLMIKSATGLGNWIMLDRARGDFTTGNNARVFANLTDVEAITTDLVETALGFELTSSNSNTNANAKEYIYMAIRAPSA